MEAHLIWIQRTFFSKKNTDMFFECCYFASMVTHDFTSSLFYSWFAATPSCYRHPYQLTYQTALMPLASFISLPCFITNSFTVSIAILHVFIYCDIFPLLPIAMDSHWISHIWFKLQWFFPLQNVCKFLRKLLFARKTLNNNSVFWGLM